MSDSCLTRALLRGALVAAPLFLTACSGGGPGGGAPPGGGGFEMPPTPVETATVVRETVADRFHAVGTIEPAETVQAVAEIDATVERLPFREGEAVARGALLAQLDDSMIRAEVGRAKAVLEQRRSAFERTRQMVASRLAPEQDLDDATAALRVAESELELARVRLEKTRILAPFAGVLGTRFVSPGAWLRAGDPVVRLSQIDAVKVLFSAPERYANELRVGRAVSIETTASPGETLTGALDLVEPSLDPGTRSVRVRARVPNPAGLLRPGMSADVTIVLAERADALVAPSEAVFAEGDLFLVYVVKADGTVARTPVVLGTRASATVEVVSGLEAGATVVRSGHQKLYEGAKVVPAGAPPAGAPPAASPQASPSPSPEGEAR